MGKVKKRDGLTGGTNYFVPAAPPSPQADGLLGRWANRMRNAQKRIGSNGSSYLNTSEYRRMNGAQQEQFRALSPEGQARVINKGRAFQSATTNGEGYGTYIGRALKDARNRENRTSLGSEVSQTAPMRNSNRQARTSSTSSVQTSQPIQTAQPASPAQTRVTERQSNTPSTSRSTTGVNTSAPKARTVGSLKNTPASGQQKPTTYTIRKGDTLGSIAKRYGVDWRALADANGIDDPNLIYAGVKLKIDPATMGKRNKRKIGIDLSKTENKRKNNNGAPDWKVGEKEINIPTAEEAGYSVNVNFPSLRMLP